MTVTHDRPSVGHAASAPPDPQALFSRLINQRLDVSVGNCPASVVLARFGIARTYRARSGAERRPDSHV
jgi:hypothetical protein